MLYRGQTIEVLGTKEVFGEEVDWVRILENKEFRRLLI